MVKSVYWPRNFWTISGLNTKVDFKKHTLNISGYLLCDGDILIDEVTGNPKGVVFNVSFDNLRKTAKVVYDESVDVSQPLSDYITKNVVEELANRIYEDYLPNVKESTDYEGNGKDEAFLKDYCIDKLVKEQESKIKKLNKELTKKLKEIL